MDNIELNKLLNNLVFEETEDDIRLEGMEILDDLYTGEVRIVTDGSKEYTIRYVAQKGGRHDGQDGQIIFELKNEEDTILFSRDMVHSSWDSNWYADDVYKVKPVKKTVTDYVADYRY